MASKRKWGCVIAAARGSLLHSRYYSEHFVLTTAYCMWSSSPCYRGNSGVLRSLHDNLRPRKRQSRDANPDGAPAGATLLTPAGQHGGTEGPAGAASTFSFHRSHWSTKASAILTSRSCHDVPYPLSRPLRSGLDHCTKLVWDLQLCSESLVRKGAIDFVTSERFCLIPENSAVVIGRHICGANFIKQYSAMKYFVDRLKAWKTT